MSTLVLEVHGGTHDQSLSTVNIAIGTKNLFGGTNSYPWNPTVTTAKRGIIIKPYTLSRTYDYDIVVELISSCNGKLDSIRTNTGSHGNDPDSTNTTVLKNDFNY
jgi:hypothetical protein